MNTKRIEELRLIIADARAELRQAVTGGMSLPEKRARRERLLAEMRADQAAKIADLAERFGLDPGTIVNYARAAGISILGRSFKGPRPRKPNGHEAEYVERYRNGETLAQIGASQPRPVTRERVRQVISNYEARTGERLPRKNHGPQVARVTWRCEVCGLTCVAGIILWPTLEGGIKRTAPQDQVPGERQNAQLRAMGGEGAGWWMPKDQAVKAHRPEHTNITAKCTCRHVTRGKGGVEEDWWDPDPNCPIHQEPDERDQVNEDKWPR